MAPSPGGAKALAVGGAVSVQAVFATYQLLGAAVLQGGLVRKRVGEHCIHYARGSTLW